MKEKHSITINNKKIEIQSSTKFLGKQIDEYLNWEVHAQKKVELYEFQFEDIEAIHVIGFD